MCDHRRHPQHQHQHQQQHHHHHLDRHPCPPAYVHGRGGGDVDDCRRPWQQILQQQQQQLTTARRPNKKSTAVRKFGGGGGGSENRTPWPPLPTDAVAAATASSSSSSSTSSSSTSQSLSPSPPQQQQQQPPPSSSWSWSSYGSRRRQNVGAEGGGGGGGGGTVGWKNVSKHFSGLPPYIKDNTEKYKNSYSQTNFPSFDHHLLYYGEMHKLHQNAYQATRTTSPVAGKQPQLQRCCKPWQWNYTYGKQAGTCNMNAYYLSDPERYADHAKNVIKEDSLVCLDGADELSRTVWRKYSDNRQSAAVYDTKMAMWRTLSALIKSRWPGCGLYMVGSTMNGFGGDVSDADFCLLTGCPSAAVANGGGGGSQLHRTADELHRACGVQRLRWLMTLLDDERPNRTADVRIVYAKVPILRFRWTAGGDGNGNGDGDGDGEMDVDLCCNNVVGIRNTHLLYCYSRLDYRVRPLVLTIKLWASRHNINDPKKMTLSSYSLVLMVINFLQCVVPPVLPSLQCIYGMKFSVDTNIEFVHMHEQLPSSGWRSDNEQSLGELLLQFFEYYNDFNFYNYAVSVRMGTPISIETCRITETVKNDPGQWKFIGIEEPFERTNTARSVHNYNVFTQIKDVINKSYTKLKETKSLDSIFCQFEK